MRGTFFAKLSKVSRNGCPSSYLSLSIPYFGPPPRHQLSILPAWWKLTPTTKSSITAFWWKTTDLTVNWRLSFIPCFRLRLSFWCHFQIARYLKPAQFGGPFATVTFSMPFSAYSTSSWLLGAPSPCSAISYSYHFSLGYIFCSRSNPKFYFLNPKSVDFCQKPAFWFI